MRVSSLLTFLIALGGCSTVDPNNIGTGRYLQVFDRSGRAVIETDTHNAGLLNCPNQANQLIQQQPTLAPLTKCSDSSFAGSLPFSFVAHVQLRESDGFRPSSPYMTRTLTSEICVTVRQSAAQMEKTVILEDNCRGLK
jgi:hypothetical protein